MFRGKPVSRTLSRDLVHVLTAFAVSTMLTVAGASAQTETPPAQSPAAAPPPGYSTPPPPGYYPPPPPGYYPPPPPGYYPPPAPMVRANNSVFVELGGNAIIYSINYERFFTDALTGRIGLGYLSVSATDTDSSAKASLTIIPMTVNYLMGGHSPHKFEIGAGALLFYASASAEVPGSSDNESGSAVFGTATAGYRYMAYDGGFLFRAGVTPIIGHGIFLPWFGLSFGFGF